MIVQLSSLASKSRMPHPRRPVPVQPGLSALDAAEVKAVLTGWPGRWCIEVFEAYDGEVSLVLMAEDDRAAPTFVLCRERERFVLDSGCEDHFERLGAFDTLTRAVQAAALVLRGLRPHV